MKRVAAVVLALAACSTGDTSTTSKPLGSSVAVDSTRPDPGWFVLESMSVARSEHPTVVLDGEIVVLGGLIETGVGQSGVTTSVESYDPADDAWESLADLPEPRHHGMASVVGDRLFFIGGYDASGFTPVATMWELVNGDWVDRADLPTPVGAGAAVTIDERIYVVGGTPNSGLLAYETGTGTWEELSPPGQAREHLAAVAIGGELWAIAGRWDGVMRSSIEIYDPSSGEWRLGPSLLEARSGFGAVVSVGGIFVAGGEIFEPFDALSTVERFLPGDGSWKAGPELPMGLHGNPLVELGGVVYLPGGSIEPAGVDNPGQLIALQVD